MIKLFFTVFPLLAIWISSPTDSPEEKITVASEFPSVIKPGSEFNITITIRKGDITGTGKFQQYLPPGLTATAIQSAGALFAFEDHSVKFLWDNLPDQKEFTISYKIKTENFIKGIQVINGLFVYWEDNKAQRQAIRPLEIKVEGGAAAEAQVNRPQVYRKLIQVSPEKGEYRVELTIQTNGIKDWATFTDDVPADYSVELIEAFKSVFSVVNHQVIFRWEMLPDNPEFTVSYLVKSGKQSTPPVINGVLVFGNQNDENSGLTEKLVANNNVNQTNLDQGKNNSIPDRGISGKSSKINTQTSPATNIKMENQERAFVLGQNPNQSAEVDEPVQEKNSLFKKIKGIFYKVQIAATKTSSTKQSNWFNSKYQINTNVEVAYHKGWKKYLVGNFLAYEEAKSYSLKTKEKIPDAFVVALDNGTIISLTEALNRKSINP